MPKMFMQNTLDSYFYLFLPVIVAKVNSIEAGHEGLTHNFISSRLDYFSEDSLHFPIT